MIGGLFFATIATLFIVPVVFSLMHRRKTASHRPKVQYRENFMLPELPPEQPRRSRWKMPLATMLFISGAALLAFTGIESRQQSVAQLKTRRRSAQCRRSPSRHPPSSRALGLLDLPGRLDAYYQAALFARVSGYVSSRNVDIGSKVKTGDLLATIDAPDLDQQLSQSESDLNNAKSNAALADVTNQRYQALLPNNYVTHQAADEKQSDSRRRRRS